VTDNDKIIQSPAPATAKPLYKFERETREFELRGLKHHTCGAKTTAKDISSFFCARRLPYLLAVFGAVFIKY
jgi:hypothetical protein